MISYGQYLRLIHKTKEALEHFKKAGAIFEKVFGKSFDRYLNFCWEVGTIMLQEGNPEYKL